MEKEIIKFNKIISDRGSKYTVSGAYINTEVDIKAFLNKLKEDKKIAKATHSSYAYRYVENGRLIEGKNDDGEIGAAMIILKTLQYQMLSNIIVCVTRWFGGVKLNNDRFKHVKNATEYFLDNFEKEKE